jgi:hypothetical protein
LNALEFGLNLIVPDSKKTPEENIITGSER